MNDVSTFGAFSCSLLQDLRAEIRGRPILAIPILPDAVKRHSFSVAVRFLKQMTTFIFLSFSQHDVKHKAITEAFCLRVLNETSSSTIPIQSPVTWPSYLTNLKVRLNFIPHLLAASSSATSATLPTGVVVSLLSSHCNSYRDFNVFSEVLQDVLSFKCMHALTPDRSRESNDSLSNFTSRLNRSGLNPFVQLSGMLPISMSIEKAFEDNVFNFTCGKALTSMQAGKATVIGSTFSRHDITRGFSEEDIGAYNSWATCQSEDMISRYCYLRFLRVVKSTSITASFPLVFTPLRFPHQSPSRLSGPPPQKQMLT